MEPSWENYVPSKNTWRFKGRLYRFRGFVTTLETTYDVTKKTRERAKL